MSNSLPYIILITVFCSFAFIFERTENNHTKTKIQYCSIGIFLIFFGLRGFILSDWINYYEYFYNCDLSYIFEWTSTQGATEPGFTLLCLIVKFIWKDFHFFVLICCIIDTLLLLKFFHKRIQNIPLALAIYICFEGLLISTNFMRNSIAILLFLNAIDYIELRDAKKYFLCIAIAISFHASALLYIPLYFFLHKKCNKWLYLSIFIFCNVVFIGKISLVSTTLNILGIDDSLSMKVRAYTEIYDKSTKISIGYLERLLTGSLIFCYYNKLIEVRKENIVFINAAIAYFMCFFLLSEFEILSKRLCALFAFGYWMLWMDLLKCFNIENNKKLFAVFISLYCILKIGSSTMLPDFKYENLLFGIQSYQERLYYHNRTFDGP